MFYVDDYTQWKLCDVEGEDPTCSDQYGYKTDVRESYFPCLCLCLWLILFCLELGSA